MIENQIIQMLKSPNPTDRQRAIRALAKSNNPQALTHLTEISANDPEQTVRDYALKAKRHLEKTLSSTPVHDDVALNTGESEEDEPVFLDALKNMLKGFAINATKGCLSLIILSVGCYVVYWVGDKVLARMNQEVAEQRQELMAQYGEAAFEMCERPQDAPLAANGTIPESAHLLFVPVNRVRLFDEYNNLLPADRLAQAEGDLDAVVCVQHVRELVQTVVYFTEAGARTDVECRRYRHYTRVYFFNVQTQQLIYKHPFTGSAPQACPHETGGSIELEGSSPQYQTVVSSILDLGN